MSSLEEKVDRTTQRFEVQAQINTNIANRLDRLEAVVATNPRTPVANRETQALNKYPPTAPVAPHSTPAFPNPLGQAGYIPPDNQAPFAYVAPYAPPLQAQIHPPVGQDDRLVQVIKPLTTDIDAFREAVYYTIASTLSATTPHTWTIAQILHFIK